MPGIDEVDRMFGAKREGLTLDEAARFTEDAFWKAEAQKEREGDGLDRAVESAYGAATIEAMSRRCERIGHAPRPGCAGAPGKCCTCGIDEVDRMFRRTVRLDGVTMEEAKAAAERVEEVARHEAAQEGVLFETTSWEAAITPRSHLSAEDRREVRRQALTLAVQALPHTRPPHEMAGVTDLARAFERYLVGVADDPPANVRTTHFIGCKGGEFCDCDGRTFADAPPKPPAKME